MALSDPTGRLRPSAEEADRGLDRPEETTMRVMVIVKATADSEAATVQVNPKCEFCRVKVSQFLCAGCSNRS